MSFTAKSESNLLIAGDELTKTDRRNENEFSSSLSQTVAGSLKPASTVNGTRFFKTSAAKANGAIQDNAKYEDANNNSSTNECYYLDYVFQLKAISLEADHSIYVNQLSVNYTADAGTADTTVNELKKAAKAFRIAFFIEKGNTSDGDAFTNDTTTVTKENEGLKFIYAPEGTENQISDPSNKAVTKATGKDETASDSLETVNYLSSKAAYVSNVATGTSYYKGVARVWLEGEDVNCTSDLFQKATKDWSVNLGFKLGSSTEMESEVKTNIDINVKAASN